MNYRDNKRVLTAEELRQMYGLENIEKNKKAISLANSKLTKVEAEQTNILKTIVINLSNVIESQSDISLWFFDGIPTLENLPALDWNDYSEHEGDYYYDRSTGYVYSFIQSEENEYKWEINNDKSLIQAMALSNAEIDTQDNLRKVFFTTPKAPYDNGDWYINNGDLYICQISKDIQEQYNPNDFIIASKYTDDTKANEVAGNLTIVSGQVTEIVKNLDVISQTIEDDRYYIDENGEKHLISTATSEMKQTLKYLQQMFQVTGGNNLIKDSMGLLGDQVWDYEEGGIYTSGYDAELIGKATSVSTRTVMNGKEMTSSNNITGLVIGNQYSLTFMASNDQYTNSTIRLKGNSTIYEHEFNDEVAMEKFSCTFIAETSNYTLEIESSTTMNGKFYIYDLMLNKGDSMPWEPANGEIYGTVLKMSQMGLQIYCTGSEIATLMTSQGFQIRRYSNGNLYEVVTEFTKDGLITNKAIAVELEVNKYKFKTIEYNNNDTLIIYKKEGE